VLPITVNYDQHLKAAVKLAMPEQILQSGHIVIGKGDAVQPSAAGLWLDINQAQLQVSDWLNSVQTGVAGNGASLTNGNDLQSLIRQINVHSEDLQWQGSSLGRFDMDLQPHQKHWTASVDSAFGSGIAILPYELNGNEKISLDLAELNLSALKQLKATSQPASLTPSSSQSLQSPRQMPLISIKSSKTLWQGLDLGSLTVETEHLPNGMAFKQIDLMGLRLQLSLTGTWKLDDGQPQTQLQGHLQIPKAGQLLVDLNISKDLAETVGSADFSFNWSAAPYDFAVKKLLGQLDVQLKEGRILSVEPGFGRILGILALEQWAKRLQLDFSDVFEEGLTFNNINGHFDLVRGNARTNNLQVDSIPAKINLKGETDFGKRIMDYEVDVIPKSADALPIAGTIMSKMTTLIARTLTGKNQDGFFFGSHYHVKGKWDNLVVIPQHENDGLFQKTWTGITAFPWLGETNKK
jgi:uncharacterized protein YhdP